MWVAMTKVDIGELGRMAAGAFKSTPVERSSGGGELREFILEYARLAQEFGKDQSEDKEIRVWWKGTQMIGKCVPKWREANVRVMLNRLVDEGILEHRLFENRRVYRLA